MPRIGAVGMDTRYASGKKTRRNSRRSTSSVPSCDPSFTTTISKLEYSSWSIERTAPAIVACSL